MPRIPKNNINTPFLHIMIQGNNKRFIFNNKEDKEKYLKILKETIKEIEVTIISYCVMGNHTHLLFHEKNINNVIKFMHKTNLLYAKYYNKKYDRVGYVFRDRYKLQPIMSERHLITCIDYIHKNPVKAGICTNQSQYCFSSYNYNCFLKGTDLENRIRNYINSKKNLIDDSFLLLEDDNDKDKDELCQSLINNFIILKNILLEQLSKDNNTLIQLVKILHNDNNISYRLIEKHLKISREKLRKVLKMEEK